MTYRYSALDRKNLAWFENDYTCASLWEIRIASGELRGLSGITVPFRYPVTAIAGRNGSGKTTILALAACAYHSRGGTWHAQGRALPYYTYSDFFLQTGDEKTPQGIRILYVYSHDKWRKTEKIPTGIGRAYIAVEKRAGGRWTNYDRRLRRAVAYLGINRVVPHAEKGASRSYRKAFSAAPTEGWEDEGCRVVGRILQRAYTSFEYRRHQRYPEKHRLGFVLLHGAKYSGFNMGAGEDALFGLVGTVLSCPERALILIDELELGLHEDAQARLVEELKSICDRRHLQVVCTTHSARVLDALPPEGRVYMERVGDRVAVIPGISTAVATGRLGGHPNAELDVLVEDDVSQHIVEAGLAAELRERVRIVPVGSARAVMLHLATRFTESGSRNACVLLDGDKRQEESDLVRASLSLVESEKVRAFAKEWVEKRLGYLPGEIAPELWLVSGKSAAMADHLGASLRVPQEKVRQALDAAALCVPHDVIHELQESLSVSAVPVLLHALAQATWESHPEEREALRKHLEEQLK